MKKTYWVRVIFLILSLGLFLHWFIGIRMYDIGIYNDYTKPIAALAFSYAIASIFLFFVSDIVFKKWLGFALVWILLSILLIVPAATHSGGIITGPTTKEEYAIFLSVLFVPISLLVLYLTARGERKRSGK